MRNQNWPIILLRAASAVLAIWLAVNVPVVAAVLCALIALWLAFDKQSHYRGADTKTASQQEPAPEGSSPREVRRAPCSNNRAARGTARSFPSAPRPDSTPQGQKPEPVATPQDATDATTMEYADDEATSTIDADEATTTPATVVEPDSAVANAAAESPVLPDASEPVAIEQHETQNDLEKHDEDDVAEEFSLPSFLENLMWSNTPMADLCTFCEEVGENTHASAFERYLARRLSEADIESFTHKKTPRIRIVAPHHSGMVYLREEEGISYGQHLHVLQIEQALNTARFAHSHFEDAKPSNEEEILHFEQRLLASVCAQVQSVETSDWSYLAMPWQGGWGPAQHGEWAVRSSLSESIETLHVPFRLEASFRSNVAGGDLAIEFASTPARAFPHSALVDGLGIVNTTSRMRSREASKYAARMGLLLANCALRASDRIRRVWIACVQTTPTSRTCWYWGCIERRSMARVRMDAIQDPLAQLQSLGTTLNLENDVLLPVSQGFMLEDERFCPPLRHDLWQLSERTLPPSAAISLGTTRVSGLRIHEELLRSLVAEDAIRMLPTDDTPHATQKGVQSVLDAANKTSDVDVWTAAERVASMMVEGSLAPHDTIALQNEFVAGDPLTKAVNKAQESLQGGHPEEALDLLDAALRSVDKRELYRDTQSVVYRSFDTFAQRALYNRLSARDKRSVLLVPDAYLVGHILLSALFLSRAQAQENDAATADAESALVHARRALEVAPLSTNSFLCLSAVLEQLDDLQEGEKVMRDMLDVAHEPQGIAMAYYRMAAIQWKLNNNTASRACYQLAVSVSPALLPLVLTECHMLAIQDPEFLTPLEASEVEEALREQNIPLAPTNRMSFLLYDCATASVDAEVFPVARDLMRILLSFSGDDVIRGIRNSLEREPDC